MMSRVMMFTLLRDYLKSYVVILFWKSNNIYIFFQFDGDGGGSIDFAEFLDLIAGKMKTFGENESSIRRAFRSLDKDHSGYITVKELKEVLNKLGEKMTTKEVQELVNEADSNGDGRIDIDEFVVLMMSN